MAGCGEAGIAARSCGDLVLNGYSDWYLPGISELNKLYLARAALGMNRASYWSSSEYNGFGHIAWGKSFLDGNQFIYNKNFNLSVRPLRSF